MTPQQMILELRALGHLRDGREWRIAEEWRAQPTLVPAWIGTNALPLIRGRLASSGLDMLAVVDVRNGVPTWKAWTGRGWRESEAVDTSAAQAAADAVLTEQGWLLL